MVNWVMGNTFDNMIKKEKDDKIKELEVKVLNSENAEKMFAHSFIVEKGLEKEYVKWVTQVKKEILKDNNLKNVLIQTDKIIRNHLKTHRSGCKCCKCKYFEQELCYKGQDRSYKLYQDNDHGFC